MSCFINRSEKAINKAKTFDQCVDASQKYNEEDDEDEEKEKLIIKTLAFDEVGDCTLVQLGDCDVLIDCGAPGQDVLRFLNQNITDNKIEYIIITHQDEDHLQGFCDGVAVWVNEVPERSIETLIDFDIRKDRTVTKDVFFTLEESLLYSNLAQSYIDKRTELIGTSETRKINAYYTASQCCFNKRLSDSACKLEEKARSTVETDIKRNNSNPNINVDISDSFTLTSSNGSSAKLKILYNRYNSFSEFKINESSLIHNSMSVCSLITYEGDNFLFTSDLMEFKTQSSRSRVFGETHLIENNDELQNLKAGVMLYKGGHHGSDSSNSAYFLSKIRPQYVSWSGVAGNENNHNFPRQSPITNVGRYTDKMFFTMIDGKYRNSDNEGTIETLYGNTTFTYDPNKLLGEKMSVDYETYDKNKGLKEPDSFFLTSFFLRNREISSPVYIYNLTSKHADPDKPYDVSYVKIGHVDILIGTGHQGEGKNSATPIADKDIVDKINLLCNDRVLDYVIVPSLKDYDYSILVGDDGLLSVDGLIIKELIRHNDTSKYSIDKRLIPFITQAKNAKRLKNVSLISEIMNDSNGKIILPLSSDNSINRSNNYAINFLKQDKNFGSITVNDSNKYSIACVVSAHDFNYLNLGCLNRYGYNEDDDDGEENEIDASSNELLQKNEDLLKNNIDVLQMPDSGYIMNNKNNIFYEFVKAVATDKSSHGYPSSNSGQEVLLNSTLYFNGDSTKYPSSCLSQRSDKRLYGLQYYKNNNKYNIHIYLTQKTMLDESGRFYLVPFNGQEDYKEGDICFRADITVIGDVVKYSTVPNFTDKDGGLLFNDTSSNFGKENDVRFNEEGAYRTIAEILKTSDFQKRKE